MTLSAKQIEARQHGVGCSEIMAAIGKDPRCTRLELYLRKVGEIPDLDFSGNERVHFGNVLEPVIREEFARRQNVVVEAPNEFDTWQHTEAPLLGHGDGFIPTENAGVEIKTADKHEAEEFGELETDQVPLRYYLQVAGYMALRDCDLWYLAVLVGGNDFRIYKIERDRELEGAILDGVNVFWQHVRKREPPEAETLRDLALRWPRHLQPSIEATDEILEVVLQHADAKLELDAAKKRADEAAITVKNFMRDAGDLVAPNGKTLATWRAGNPRYVFNESDFMADNFDLYREFVEEKPGTRPFLNKLYRNLKK